MKTWFYTGTSLVLLAIFPMTATAEDVVKNRKLNNVEIFYMETQPTAKEEGTARGKYREIFRKFESISEEEKKADAAGGDLSSYEAEKIVYANGYLDMPLPLFSALMHAFSQRHVLAAPVFYSAIRNKNEVEKIGKELGEKYSPLPGGGDYTLLLMPYRVSFRGVNDAVLMIGVNIRGKKINDSFGTQYLSVPFGATRSGFAEADGERIASILIKDFEKNGWITVENKNGD